MFDAGHGANGRAAVPADVAAPNGRAGSASARWHRRLGAAAVVGSLAAGAAAVLVRDFEKQSHEAPRASIEAGRPIVTVEIMSKPVLPVPTASGRPKVAPPSHSPAPAPSEPLAS